MILYRDESTFPDPAMATTPLGDRCEEETRRIEELTRWEKETAASSLGQVRRRPEKEGAEG